MTSKSMFKRVESMTEKSIKEMSLLEIEEKIREWESKDSISEEGKIYLEILREAKIKRISVA